MIRTLLSLMICLFTYTTYGQINAKLVRYVDVSATQITFVYGGDIWIMPKSGGMATQITHSPGEESWPRFSPDGNEIAFTANYNGNTDVYVMPTQGGIPVRVTYASFPDRMVDWHPDGQHLLFASRREMGQRSANQLFKVKKTGGLPVRLALPYGELASYAPDGNQLAYITKITENYPFKRYRGGLTSDILIYDLVSNKVENITNNTANDGKPAWAGDKIYFLSDQGKDFRLNLWMYDTQTKETKQVTKFKDFDISFMATGPSDLVFEKGGSLFLMDLSTQKYKAIEVKVVSDLSVELPKSINVSSRINSMTASPEGKRIIFEARGELFNVPVKEGYTENLTQSSGAFDQNPAWSPDGKHLAYWSDKGGEYEIYLQRMDTIAPEQKLTNRNKGFGYRLYWSPDSKQIAYIDEKNDISIINVETKQVIIADNTDWNTGHGGRYGYPIAWSPDSKWLSYSKGLESGNYSIFLYNLDEQKVTQATSGYYSDFNPVFSQDGKYLFYNTDRNLSPIYSDFDNTWVYPNATQIASLSLTKDVPSLMYPKNDDLAKGDKAKAKKDTAGIKVTVDFEDLESRLVILPPKAGNMSLITALEGKLVYRRYPNSGSGENASSLMLYDLKAREEKEIIGNVNSVVPAADNKSLLIRSKSRYAIIKPAPGQKIKDAIPTRDLNMNLVPKEEWRQIFMDTWRRHRDFFYDPNMHGLDWAGLRDQYGALLDDCRTRWDVSNLQSNLAGELSAGHTYTFGGDAESVKRSNTGYLGIDWAQENGKYKIKRMVRPAAWDTEVRSPLDQPGLDVNVGDYILSVNGMTLDPNKDPFAMFEGLSGKTVSLMVSSTGSTADSKQIIVKCLSLGQEGRLRHLEWMENNRKMVAELSNNQLGYIYMSNTAGLGQLELVRMYYGQLDKKGFILDERFNGGGQLADRFLELLNRPVVYNLHWRHGKDHTWPIKTNTGPVGMVINGWAGSGGDALPWGFQELELGPIVGERTLGILVGPATGHQLIDRGGITVPGARLYDNDGHWFWEGEGVAPDIKVWDDPNLLMQGKDPQLARCVEEVVKQLGNAPTMTPKPRSEDRTAAGLNKKK